MNRLTTGAIKALIVILAVVLALFFALFVSLEAGELAAQIHDPSYHQGRFLTVVTCVQLFLLCAIALLVCVWRLVTLAGTGRLFDDRAFAWVNAALVVTLVASGLDLVATIAVLFVGSGIPPMIPVVGVVGAIVGVGLALVIVVMRALLRQATDLRSELAEVI